MFAIISFPNYHPQNLYYKSYCVKVRNRLTVILSLSLSRWLAYDFESEQKDLGLLSFDISASIL